MADDTTPGRLEGPSESEERPSHADEMEQPQPEVAPAEPSASEPLPSGEEPREQEPAPSEPPRAEAGPGEMPAPVNLAEGESSWLDSAPLGSEGEPAAAASEVDMLGATLDDTSPAPAVTVAEVAAVHGLAEATGGAPPENVDPAAAQQTQLLPVTTEAPPQPPVPLGPVVSTGSRVIIVVSRGASPVPPPAFVKVPHVIGQLQGEALGKLQEAGLSAQVFNDFDDKPRGEVIGQLPPSGDNAPVGLETVLLVSSGAAPVAALKTLLPLVTGLTESDAIASLQSAGLSPQIVRDYSPTVPLGVVIEQLPGGRVGGEKPRKKRSLAWLWVLLVLAIMVAVGGGVYYYMNRTAIVPSVVGLPQNQAEQAIAAAGFKIGSVGTTQTISASQVGNVTSQSPAPNTQHKLSESVSIVVSGGQLLFQIPNVVGKPSAEASSEIKMAGLQVTVTQSYNATVPKDAVISEFPAAGEKVPSGTTVGIVVSQGVQSVTVPGVSGQTKDQAFNTLKSASLSSQAVIEYSKDVLKGQVFAQYPAAGTSVAPGTIIGFLVSQGPPTSDSTATVPQLVGLRQKAAQDLLNNAHLTSVPILWSGTGRPKGEVVGQAPESGANVPRKVAVILFLSNGK